MPLLARRAAPNLASVAARSRVGRAAFAATIAIAGLLLADGSKAADWSGRVVGKLGNAASPGLAGVAVTNGVTWTTTDAEGVYRIDAPAPGDTVRITQPRGFECDPWYRSQAGDFVCRRAADPESFLFLHVSDVHAYRDPDDFVQYSIPRGGSWLPEAVRRRLMLWFVDRLYRELSRDQLTKRLRESLPESGAEVADVDLLPAFQKEFLRPGSRLGDVGSSLDAAFDEMSRLDPAFVVSTGDLILEGNLAPPEAARRWMQDYVDEVRTSGLRFHHTIGNNEIVSSSLEGHEADPDHGKGLYRRRLGPTTYAFERGRLRFIVLDTHFRRRGWSFYKLDRAQRAWLEADLAARPNATVVVLNHEPFGWDPESAYADMDRARDDGRLARHGVPYVLTGHAHRTGVWHDGVTTHVSTGAVSGMRWFLPESIHERGVRLVWVDGDRLFSAWKRLGRPAVGFVSPRGPAALSPSGAERAADDEIVALAVDSAGPFASVVLEADGRRLPIERWGRYFVRGRRPAGAESLRLEARRRDGTVVEAVMMLGATPALSDD